MFKNNIKNACLVIIGNEILTGRTQDKNINHIAKELFKVGILLSYVCVIPDIQKIIIKEIRRLKKNYNYVITTGGIGPTHDDIIVALAKDWAGALNSQAANTFYNLLDLISKNIMGIVVSVIVLNGHYKDVQCMVVNGRPWEMA